jgi:hypothetical protein
VKQHGISRAEVRTQRLEARRRVLKVNARMASSSSVIAPESHRVRCVRSAPGAAPLAHLKQIPVGILKARGVALRELKHLRRLKLHAARCKHVERCPAIIYLDGVDRGTELGLGWRAWPQNQFEILSRNADGQKPRSVGVGASIRFSKPMMFV